MLSIIDQEDMKKEIDAIKSQVELEESEQKMALIDNDSRETPKMVYGDDGDEINRLN